MERTVRMWSSFHYPTIRRLSFFSDDGPPEFPNLFIFKCLALKTAPHSFAFQPCSIATFYRSQVLDNEPNHTPDKRPMVVCWELITTSEPSTAFVRAPRSSALCTLLPVPRFNVSTTFLRFAPHPVYRALLTEARRRCHTLTQPR